MFNYPKSAEAGLLNKSSYLTPALGVTKFIIVRDIGSDISIKSLKRKT
jgi:hypothetical protein